MENYLSINMTFRITVMGEHKKLPEPELRKFVSALRDRFLDRIMDTALPGKLDMEADFDDDLSYYTQD